MQKHNLWNSLSIFETGLSAAEWGWRIFTLLFIGGSGTITALIAKADPILKNLGPIYWISIGVIIALITSTIFYLIKSAALKQSLADLHRTIASPKDSINPLLENFKDTIIPIEDLRLPLIQLHEDKHFKRCQFVGPGAIAITGGTYSNNGFAACGDIVALPNDLQLTGVVVLKNCTVQECEFIKVTILVDQHTAKEFSKAPGAIVKGINP